MKGKSNLFNGIGKRTLPFYHINLQFFAEKKVSQRGQAILKSLENKKLKNLVTELYRGGADEGDGSAMAAASVQVNTGVYVKNKNHVLKINERISNLSNIIKKEKLNVSDTKYANKLMNQMKASLKGKYKNEL